MLDVAVDAARGLLGGPAAGQLPGARLAAAEVAGEEGDVAEHLVAGAEHDVERAGLVGAELGAELGGLLRFEVGELRLEARGDGDHLVAPSARPLHEVRVLLKGGGRALVVVRVQDEQHGAVAHERQLPEERLVLGRPCELPRQRSLQEGRVQRLEHLELALGRLVAAARRLAGLVQAALDQFRIAEHQLGLDEVHVVPGIEPLAHVRDLRVVERAHHLRHGVDAADVGEEAVAESLATARPFGEARDVDEVDGGVDLLRRLKHLVQSVQTRVRHRHDATVGLRRRERIGGRRRLRVRERVEQGGLADVGQSDDAELHGRLSSSLVSRVSRSRDMCRSCVRTLPGRCLST
ncbi:MAG: hypothetical protein BWY94_01930 [Actinobacteria bacterium ADurb.BinA094]|nr:MAG: hypothetical protein BWY94_01930 [Actinobacteria bacterium ADurb.BinA094]